MAEKLDFEKAVVKSALSEGNTNPEAYRETLYSHLNPSASTYPNCHVDR